MKLIDLKSFMDYVEAALPVFPKKWKIEEVTCNDNSASFRFVIEGTGIYVNPTEVIVDRVAQEMGRRGRRVDVWLGDYDSQLIIGFTDEADV